MHGEYHRILLVFVDGIGLASPGEHNPFSTVPTPALRRLLGGPLTLDSVQEGDELTVVGVDACLGVDGLPQSATGQTALFTGINAPREIGHHVTALPGPRLRALLEEHSVFLQVERLGLTATFANAYTDRYLELIELGERRASASTAAVRAAGVGFRRIEHLLRGEAVSWDVCRDRFGQHVDLALEPVSAERAGADLARIASSNDLTVYETFLTDLAGHGRAPAQEAVERVDRLLAGVLAERSVEVTVLVTSDHGNLEDTSTRAHTRNPVPLIAVGPRARHFARVERLTDVTPRIVDALRNNVDAIKRARSR